MAWPGTIRVKLSSETAGAISVAPVVVRELTPRELIEQMLGITGKDERRIREILGRGTLVSGASRFRWPGWEPASDSLRELLAGFRDPDPSLPFSKERCLRAVLPEAGQSIELRREGLSQRAWLGRRSFWHTLMEVAGTAAAAYREYSYRDRAGSYLRRYTADEIDLLRGATGLIRPRALGERIRTAAFAAAEFYVERAKPEARAR